MRQLVHHAPLVFPIDVYHPIDEETWIRVQLSDVEYDSSDDESGTEAVPPGFGSSDDSGDEDRSDPENIY